MPPVPAPSGQRGMQGPSNFEKWKMGAMMGGSVGLIMGFILGGYNIMRYGAGQDGPLRQLSKYMLGSSATFGFFMSIGSVIRTEAPPGVRAELFYRLHDQRPVVRPRPQRRTGDARDLVARRS